MQSITRLTDRLRGTSYYMGDNTGVRHVFVDTLVQNGQRYYYALNAYDKGSSDFYPAENNIAISVAEDGAVTTGANVAEVVPNAPVLGFEAGGLSTALQPGGSNRGTGDVFVNVVDPRPLTEGESYTIQFNDPGGDNPVSSAFSVIRQSDGVAIARDVPLSQAEGQVFDGIQMALRNDATRIDTTYYAGGTQGDTLFVQAPFNIVQGTTWRFQGSPLPYDYEIRFGEPATSLGGITLGTGRLAPTAVATQTTFSVYNTTLGRPSEFAFIEGPTTRDGSLNAVNNTNESVFIFETVDGERRPVMALRTDARNDRTFVSPPAGARYAIEFLKPFSPSDRFTFQVKASKVDNAAIAAQMERIRAVPNPYVVSSTWERPLPNNVRGRGERQMSFTHLPAGAVVRIYTSRGEFVRELVHDSSIDDGTVNWNLRTREDLDVAFGVYFYHVQAPGGAEKTGKFAIIK